MVPGLTRGFRKTYGKWGRAVEQFLADHPGEDLPGPKQ
jgi:hypothetical protein